jgi:hypothetical protein
MPVDASTVRQNYVIGLQAAAKLAIQFNNVMRNLSNLYNGASLSGTFADNELSSSAGTKHLSADDVGTLTFNLSTIQTAMSDPIMQNLAKAVGSPVT